MPERCNLIKVNWGNSRALNNSEWKVYRDSTARTAQSPGDDQRGAPALLRKETGEFMMQSSFRGHRKFFNHKPP